MERYRLSQFDDRLEAVEAFLIDLIANEGRLQELGYRGATNFQSSEKGLEALNFFNEDFIEFKAYTAKVDESANTEVDVLDYEGKLIEQLSNITLKLRVSLARGPVKKTGLSFFLGRLFGEVDDGDIGQKNPMSLRDTYISIRRLRAVVRNFIKTCDALEFSENPAFNSSNISVDEVVVLLDEAIDQVSQIKHLSSEVKDNIEKFLKEAKLEIALKRPSWQKILGALVIASAVIGGVADSDKAASNIKNIIQIIISSSVGVSQLRFYPATGTTALPESINI
jgi:hypothetical protein